MKTPKQRHGATAINSIHTAGVSSVPKTQRSPYLELYTLGREKNRLMKEMLALDDRRETIYRHLGSIGARILKLQQETAQESGAKMGIKTPSQPVKIVDISY